MHVSVILSTGGACVVAPGGVPGCSGGGMRGCSGGVGCAWLLWGGHVWDITRYGDTINERAVRILLECILVTHESPVLHGICHSNQNTLVLINIQ